MYLNQYAENMAMYFYQYWLLLRVKVYMYIHVRVMEGRMVLRGTAGQELHHQLMLKIPSNYTEAAAGA